MPSGGGDLLASPVFAAVGGVRLWDLHSRNICRRGSQFSRVRALSGSNFILSCVAGLITDGRGRMRGLERGRTDVSASWYCLNILRGSADSKYTRNEEGNTALNVFEVYLFKVNPNIKANLSELGPQLV